MTREEDEQKRRIRKKQKTTNAPAKLSEIERRVMIARQKLNEFKDAVDDAKNPLTWSLEDWKDFFRSTPMDTYRLLKELITHKKQKELQQGVKDAEKEAKFARKMFEVTGMLPGEKSGVVKADKIAEKKREEHLHKVTIYTARLLAYGKDDKLKEEVMKEVTQRHPELVPKIKTLAQKAKQRANDRVVQTMRAGRQ